MNGCTVIGVSGGIDSMALAVLAKSYFHRILTVTVDHRLRIDSADEAGHIHNVLEKKGSIFVQFSQAYIHASL